MFKKNSKNLCLIYLMQLLKLKLKKRTILGKIIDLLSKNCFIDVFPPIIKCIKIFIHSIGKYLLISILNCLPLSSKFLY